MSSVTTVLIVDDELDLRDAMAFDFKRKKYNVLTAGNGSEAKKIIETQKVDIVLSDVRMAGGDGLELLEWIKAKNVFIPVVMFITGFADITLEEAYDKGADAVFSKPFDRKALMAAVERAVQPMDHKFNRKSSRVEADLAIGLKVVETGISIQSKTLNIGRGGVFIALSEGFPKPQQEVEFQLGPLPGSEVIVSGRGIIRWIRESDPVLPSGCGMEFLQLNEECASQVLSLINTLKTKAFIPLK